ncbi:MAG TPA: caspase family protein [Phaeodactylibacter sp.]|nr:caspase family protein [Phaeodactylibacter sp.]
METQYPQAERNIVTLLDEEATYEQLILQFGSQHLAKAKKGDIVFFHFSGHGARGLSAKDFRPYFPDGRDENLICYDSRLPGHFDLADKELAALIERVADKGAEVIVILDCCHSGSGTRQSGEGGIADSRQWEDREELRPLESYLGGHFTERIYLPNPRHLLMAACAKKEKAMELSDKRGAFTAMLLQALEKGGTSLSYVDLYEAVRRQLRKHAIPQTPQMEAYGNFNVHRHFLKNTEAATRLFPVFYENEKWQMQTGALQGMSLMPDEETLLEICDADVVLGTARVLAFDLDVAHIAPEILLDKSKPYTAKILSLPKAPVEVAKVVETTKIGALEKALQKHLPLYFELVDDASYSPFVLHIGDKSLKILRREDESILAKLPDKDVFAYLSIFERLEHLARWQRLLHIGAGREGVSGAVKLLLDISDGEVAYAKTIVGEERLDINVSPQGEKKTALKYSIEIENASDESWHLALLHFTQDYGVRLLYHDDLPAKTFVMAAQTNHGGRDLYFQLKNKTNAREYFKLIASKNKINAPVLCMDDLDLKKMPTLRGTAKRKVKAAGNLERWFCLSLECVLSQK